VAVHTALAAVSRPSAAGVGVVHLFAPPSVAVESGQLALDACGVGVGSGKGGAVAVVQGGPEEEGSGGVGLEVAKFR